MNTKKDFLLLILLFCVNMIIFSQSLEEVDFEIMKKLKIKSVTEWYCNDSLCDNKEIFYKWEFDKFGNLIEETLGDPKEIEDIDYQYFYKYDSINRIIEKKEIKIESIYDDEFNYSARKYDTIDTYYFYDLSIKNVFDPGVELIKISYGKMLDSLHYKTSEVLDNDFIHSDYTKKETHFFIKNQDSKLVYEYFTAKNTEIKHTYDMQGRLILTQNYRRGKKTRFIQYIYTSDSVIVEKAGRFVDFNITEYCKNHYVYLKRNELIFKIYEYYNKQLKSSFCFTYEYY